MHIKCPGCGAVASLDVLIAAEDGATEVVQLVGELEPETYRIVMQYLRLFRPRKSKLAWSRVATILGELVPMIKATEFTRGGQRFHAPLPYWHSAMEEMLSRADKFTSPLKNHGYLLEVMMSIDVKAKGVAEKITAQKATNNHESTPPEKQATAQDTGSKPSMPPAEAHAAFKEVLSKLKGGVVSATKAQTPEEIEDNRQRAIDELSRRAALKEEEKNHETNP